MVIAHRESGHVLDAERQCRFLQSVITVESDDGPVSLELSGLADTREFIAGLLTCEGQRPAGVLAAVYEIADFVR